MTKQEKEYKKAIQLADSWATRENKQFGIQKYLYTTAKNAGEKIAKHYKVDIDIIHLGTILMDIKLGKAKQENKLKEHTKMSHKTTANLLNKFKISSRDKKKILDGVKYHHGTKKFPSLEAEIIANADCYKFLSLINIKKYLKTLKQRGLTKKQSIKQAQYKFNEKKRALSLAYCKKDLKFEIKKTENYLKNLQIS
jgi:hypothetical protein